MFMPQLGNQHTLRLKRISWFLVAICASIVLSACSVTQTVSQVSDTRAIQDDFDAASRLQTNMFAIDRANEAISSQTNTAQIMQANRGLMLYQRVINGVNSLESQKAELIQNGLWANLQTLKAMSQWQIGNKEDALITANLAIKEAQDLQGRDMVLLNAIPSLVANDEAFEMLEDLKISGNKDENAFKIWQRATALYEKAENELSVIIDNVAHPQLQFYLQLSRLMVVKNWEESFDLDLCITDSCEDIRMAKNEQSKVYFEDLLLSRYKATGSCDAVMNSSFYQFWSLKIGTFNSSKGTFKKVCP
ncbi:hypothetical protein [Glaciecola petra]|uniref:Lipoprotein n=1 Tax=Glaciecola petra TaxID=3075602 RepID=A0ABU2ZRZ7_9ALTE|nr:hypothetical protein [Aestuariibacter sp. P117]MDT0595409.1 hypothetical protein [Aestuariibacter sp. P117]